MKCRTLNYLLTAHYSNMLAEASAKDISEAVKPKTFDDSKKVAKQGGTIARNARRELEAKTGKKVVTSLNAATSLPLKESDKQETKKQAKKKTKNKGQKK